ncbi:4Fe-4S dicluster domain-containing protein [Methanomassiliicoccus luminyensis]|uniref:4Fe-4S dicluster domain-containing protein n=1 Tax=Methanomassiliicoccus luminyensis TaxID=1080712 RepID=UPI00038251B3|nr:4Fe-4S dicluster domain-containing protein [Methanomassiliicoccus luminyensis]
MSMLTSALKNLFRRPFTTTYPAVPADLPPDNRGRVVWDMQKCIWCRKCERSCPSRAITTDKEAKTQTIVRHRCIGCNTCVEVCPTQTITMLPDYSKPDTAPVVHVFWVGMPKHEYRVEHLPRQEGRPAVQSLPDEDKGQEQRL